MCSARIAPVSLRPITLTYHVRPVEVEPKEREVRFWEMTHQAPGRGDRWCYHPFGGRQFSSTRQAGMHVTTVGGLRWPALEFQIATEHPVSAAGDY